MATVCIAGTSFAVVSERSNLASQLYSVGHQTEDGGASGVKCAATAVQQMLTLVRSDAVLHDVQRQSSQGNDADGALTLSQPAALTDDTVKRKVRARSFARSLKEAHASIDPVSYTTEVQRRVSTTWKREEDQKEEEDEDEAGHEGS